MEIRIQRLNDLCAVSVDGNTIPGVMDYKIESSMHHGTELSLTIQLNEDISLYETSANPTE